MLKKIKTIQGVGLFCKAEGAEDKELAEVTLVFAENARGKSTLASILGAAATADAAPVEERRTIDQQIEPRVQFEFDRGRMVQFESGRWTGDASSLRVFDSEFIDRNVHSGSVIDVNHRRNLLALAVGEESVRAKRAQEALDVKRAEAQAKKNDIEAGLAALRGKMPLAEFLGLPELTDVDALIEAKKAELTSALSSRSIASQEKPRLHAFPELDIESLFEVLSCTLEDLEGEAEDAVRAHIAGLKESGAQRWVGEGLEYYSDETCPFCGQGTEGVELIGHYRSIFNDAYRQLRERIDGLNKAVDYAVPANAATELANATERAKEAIESWVGNGHIVVASQAPEIALAEQWVSNFRNTTASVIEMKQRDLNYTPSEHERNNIREAYNNYVGVIEQQNSVVQAALDAITQYLSTLGSLNHQSIADEVFRLEQARARHSPDAVALADAHGEALAEIKEIEEEVRIERKRERSALDASLGKYTDRINAHLSRQFAPFRIADVGTTYSGGTPGTTYTIKVRGQAVNLKGAENSFKTALSESDKRSMALAFFLAATLDDPDLDKKTVVVDDPMSSLDRNRRANTVKTLANIALKCDQLIVLAHDPKFLLDLDSEIKRTKKYHASDGGMHPVKRKHLRLKSVIVDSRYEAYTDFDDCDLALECESKYARNYRTLIDFVSDPTNDHLVAAAAIRPLLEGYLHRRFPSQLPQNSMFGQAIKVVREASGDSPLVNAQNQVEDMVNVAYFGNESHHDSDIDYQPPIPNHTEIYNYAKECLRIVHGA